ncbi:hypothetical protein HO173_013097 [Letharia columbiana]|uniref:Uncharacterized protein n=1 Tax=Letharia columbiana TaxID=112416 RepID=A0A8H6CIP2_9LECA|nr:uncharacterized protein HO173_013097 [Letharia columbiana]KAF6223876.1 hypothetical protein HO173_013097 [Letharia columbiana]
MPMSDSAEIVVEESSPGRQLETADGQFIDDQPSDEVVRGKSMSPNIYQVPPTFSLPPQETPRPGLPRGWAADKEDADRRALEKQERKERRRAEKDRQREERQEAAEESRLRGEDPPQPCKFCKQNHWSQDCDRPTGKTAPPSSPPEMPTSKRGRADTLGSPQLPVKKKTKKAWLQETSSIRASSPAARSETSGGVALPSRAKPKPKSRLRPPHTPVQESKVVPTRRSEKGGGTAAPAVSALGDGRWLYLKMPSELRGKQNEPTLRQITEGLEEIMELKNVVSAEPHDAKGWMVYCHSSAVVEEAKNRSFHIGSAIVHAVGYHAAGAPSVHDEQEFARCHRFSSPGCTDSRGEGLQGPKILGGIPGV